MPNHVKHIIEVKDDMGRFWDAIKSGDCLFDFNRLIPRPDPIKLPDGVDGIASDVTDGAELLMMHNGWPVYDYNGTLKRLNGFRSFGHRRKWEDKDFMLFKRCCHAIELCGYSNWWDWSAFHWDTKWNAYSVKRDGDTLRLQTAWDTPMKIWEKIAKNMPKAWLIIKYASEDYGSHCGTITIKNGELAHAEINTDKFAYEVLAAV